VTRLQYALTDTEVVLDHSSEQVIVNQAGKVLRKENLQTNFPRLTNHYVNLFSDVAEMFNSGQTNLPRAIALHQLLFEAMT